MAENGNVRNFRPFKPKFKLSINSRRHLTYHRCHRKRDRWQSTTLTRQRGVIPCRKELGVEVYWRTPKRNSFLFRCWTSADLIGMAKECWTLNVFFFRGRPPLASLAEIVWNLSHSSIYGVLHIIQNFLFGSLCPSQNRTGSGIVLP